MASYFNNVLVCLNHSSHDTTIISNACKFCKAANPKKLIFLNVIKDFNIPESVKKEFPELMNNALIEREKQIKALVNDNFNCDTPMDTLIMQGNETKEILRAAFALKVDLIIIGRKRNSDSILTTRIARRSPSSILIIPEKTALAFDNVLVPIDFSDHSLLSIDQALGLIGDNHSKVYLQNVFQVPSSYRYSGKSYDEFAALMEDHASKDMKSLLQHIRPGNHELIPIFTLDKSGNVMQAVYGQAKAMNTNIIVMGAKGRTTASAIFIGSKAEKMIRINTDIPIMVVRKKGAVVGLLESIMDI